MRSLRIASLTLVTSMVAVVTLMAQAPAGSTGTCNDGTYTSAKTKTGACSAHGGVKVWVGTPAPAPKPAPPPPPSRTAPPPASTARPANATGRCGDGSFTTAKSKTGACSSHGGVSDWFAAAAAPTAPPPPPAARTSTPPPAPAPAPKVAPVAGAPAAATALCNDGTYSESQHRSGTCSNHKGVKQWLKSIPPQ